MNRQILLPLVLGIFGSTASAKDCTISNDFQIAKPQLLMGRVENRIAAIKQPMTLELLSGREVVIRTILKSDRSYSFGEVPRGKYKIHVRYYGDPFCAPVVKCDQDNCSVDGLLELNPKNKLATVD